MPRPPAHRRPRPEARPRHSLPERPRLRGESRSDPVDHRAQDAPPARGDRQAVAAVPIVGSGGEGDALVRRSSRVRFHPRSRGPARASECGRDPGAGTDTEPGGAQAAPRQQPRGSGPQRRSRDQRSAGVPTRARAGRDRLGPMGSAPRAARGMRPREMHAGLSIAPSTMVRTGSPSSPTRPSRAPTPKAPSPTLDPAAQAPRERARRRGAQVVPHSVTGSPQPASGPRRSRVGRRGAWAMRLAIDARTTRR